MSVLVGIYRGSNRGTEVTLVTAIQVCIVLEHNIIIIGFRGLAHRWLEDTCIRC